MTEFYTHCGTERYFDFEDKVCDEETGKALTVKEIVTVLNELNEKYTDEFSLRETLQLELQRIEEENKELLSYINTLGVGIQKILHNISDGRDAQAMIVCVELLKKLEEEELIGI